MITIKKYKEVSLKYNEQDGMIHFNFEDKERRTKYVFEAEAIIDEPVWKDCNLEGYFVDGYIDKFIGLARATKKDIKSGKPQWNYKGQYDMEYKQAVFNHDFKVFPRNIENDRIYTEWKNQQDIYKETLKELNVITKGLNK